MLGRWEEIQVKKKCERKANKYMIEARKDENVKESEASDKI